MEHIVQFAVSIDDDAIVKRVTEHAEEKIVKELTQQVRNQLFESRSYYRHDATNDDPLSAYSERLLTKWLDDHKDEIVDKAAKFLAEKLARTKAVKERVAKEIE